MKIRKFLRKLFQSKESKEIEIQIALGTLSTICPECSGGKHTDHMGRVSSEVPGIITADVKYPEKCFYCNGTGKVKPYCI